MNNKRFRFLLIMFGLCLVFLLCFRFVLTSGQSMEPTYAPRTLLLCIRHPLSVEPGDVVLIQKDNMLAVKRVYADAGDTVRFVDIEEPYHSIDYGYWTTDEPAVIPEGYFFVIGDNWEDSYDSRYPEFGLISNKQICGKIIGRFPPNISSLEDLFYTLQSKIFSLHPAVGILLTLGGAALLGGLIAIPLALHHVKKIENTDFEEKEHSRKT